MIKFITYALQLVIILILLKVCFNLVVMVMVGFIKAIPTLVLAVLALVLLDKIFDNEEEEE